MMKHMLNHVVHKRVCNKPEVCMCVCLPHWH